MKIWIAKDSEVSIREQLSAQITLGIAAGDYQVGERLPSTQEIARRCGVHANTVGAVYRDLAEEKLLEFRPGSGFYVAESAANSIAGSHRLDELIKGFMASVNELGFTREDVLRRIRTPRPTVRTDRVVLVEPDEDLRQILLYELSCAGLDVSGADHEDLAAGRVPKRILLTALFDEKPKLDAAIDNGQKCVYLSGRSVSATMSDESRPAPEDIIAVVSGWEGFLTFARIMLLAAKIDPGNLIVRSTSEPNWKSTIATASIVICDALTASILDDGADVRPFRIISDESISDLRSNLPLINLPS